MIDAWSLILFVQIAAVVYAVILLNVARTVRNATGIDRPAQYARSLAVGGLAMFLAGSAIVVAMSWVWHLVNERPFDDKAGVVVPMVWCGLNALLAMAAAFYLLQASKLLQSGQISERETPLRHAARNLALTGWLILLVPVIIISVGLAVVIIGFSLWGMLLVAVIGISVTLIVAGKRKADQAAVLWALAIATERDLPLPAELDAVAAGLSSGHRRRTKRLAELLRDGCPLPVALQQMPRVIPRFALLAAQVGDENGTLPAALRDAAVRQTRSAESSGGGVSSPTMVIAYLLLMPLFCALTLSFLMYFIVPKYKKIFAAFDTELPEVTKSLLNVSDFFVLQPLLLFPLVLLPAGIVFCAAFAHQRGWGEFDPPLFGRLLRRLDVPNLLRNLAETLSADRPLREALAVMSLNHPRRALRKALTDALQALQKGDDCWYALKDAGLLTPNETAVLRSAQRVGNLPWALHALADGIERRFCYRWRAVLEFAQPVVVVTIGLISAALCFAFFMPLLKLIGGLT